MKREVGPAENTAMDAIHFRPRFSEGLGKTFFSGGFFVLGFVALFGAGYLLARAPVPKPFGSGEVGEVRVFGQTVEGPYALTPERTAVLPRPQALAFQVTVRGVGPRLVRLDLEDAERLRTLYEARLVAPLDQYALDYVARFGESAPDVVVVWVTVEAPHQRPRTRRYRLRFATANHRFWDLESRGGGG